MGSGCDSPGSLSSSCSITDLLSDKYRVSAACRSAAEPGLGSDVDSTSVIVFFFLWRAAKKTQQKNKNNDKENKVI